MKFEDVHGEYLRICPYCQEYFTADHMNRKFCPRKNGKNNFCKNRWKRLKQANTNNSSGKNPLLRSVIVKTLVNADDLPETTTSLKTLDHTSPLMKQLYLMVNYTPLSPTNKPRVKKEYWLLSSLEQKRK